ncbi:hypothetical protein KKF55_00155, partial [Patescibacteria group bacterium]|nr:hypothetical protein [Patescibacteria group bacterium]
MLKERHLSYEPLERRDLFTGNSLPVNDIIDFGQAESAAEIGNVLYSDTFDDNSTAAAFWGMPASDVNVENGELVMKTGKLFTSERELPPSPENPLVVKFDFKIPGSGVEVLTRYDGNMGNGRPRNALAFCVESNSAGIYLYNQDGGTRLFDGNGRKSYVDIPKLSYCKFYTLVVEDRGDSASLTVFDGDRIVEKVGGALTRDAKGNKIGMSEFGSSPQRVYVDNIEMTYGTKAVEEPVVEVV